MVGEGGRASVLSRRSAGVSLPAGLTLLWVLASVAVIGCATQIQEEVAQDAASSDSGWLELSLDETQEGVEAGEASINQQAVPDEAMVNEAVPDEAVADAGKPVEQELQFEDSQEPGHARDLESEDIKQPAGEPSRVEAQKANDETELQQIDQAMDDSIADDDTAADAGVELQLQLEPEPMPVALDDDGPRYQVTKLDLGYEAEHPSLPPIEELGDVVVNLTLTETGYIAPRQGAAVVAIPLSSIDEQLPQLQQYWFYASALRTIAQSVVAEMNNRGMIGVFVSPHPDDIEDGDDQRDRDMTSLRLVIRTVTVTQVRTLGSGERVDALERINNPVHAQILQLSPVKPSAEGEQQRRDLLRRDLLDDYIFRLNRHPGRRVDLAVSRAEERGGVVLDYLIAENSPVLMYAQISNTGTEQTDEWRERFGLVHNQVTDRDDVLSIDYVTAAFDESHSVVGSYEAPLGGDDRLKWRVFGSWGQFTATDVGSTLDSFVGDNWTFGGEVIVNIFQKRDLFVDFFFGARHEHIFVDNRAALLKGEDNFFLPYIGFNVERISDISSTLANVSVERNIPGMANTDQSEIDNFGRSNPEDRWTLLKWNVNHSFYLEPALDREAWTDINTPETSTLAHEIALAFKGQWAFGSRLIPQMESVAGGLYSVRGYRESATAGDSLFIGSFEYRYHVPRAFSIQPNPSNSPLFGKPFRFAPQQVYGRPDWDLILKGFVDAARVLKSDRLNIEKHETLIGAGAGVEIQFQRVLNVRVDWGVALEEADDVQDGSEQVHIVATLLF
jgi:hypothetical protein